MPRTTNLMAAVKATQLEVILSKGVFLFSCDCFHRKLKKFLRIGHLASHIVGSVTITESTAALVSQTDLALVKTQVYEIKDYKSPSEIISPHFVM